MGSGSRKQKKNLDTPSTIWNIFAPCQKGHSSQYPYWRKVPMTSKRYCQDHNRIFVCGLCWSARQEMRFLQITNVKPHILRPNFHHSTWQIKQRLYKSKIIYQRVSSIGRCSHAVHGLSRTSFQLSLTTFQHSNAVVSQHAWSFARVVRCMCGLRSNCFGRWWHVGLLF